MTLSRAAALVLLPLTLAGCGDVLEDLDLPGFGKKEEPAAAAPAAPPAAPQPPAVSPLEVPIEVAGTQTPVGTANAETLNVTAFTARGNEPFWSVAVNGDKALLKRAGAKDATVTVKRVNFAGGVEFAGTLAGSVFTVNIKAADCQDSMSGADWPMTATVRWGGEGHPGCAAPTGSEPKTPEAATAGAVPPKAG